MLKALRLFLKEIKPLGLAKQILIPYLLCLLFSACIYLFYNVNFLYCIEDSYLEREIKLEAQHIQKTFDDSGLVIQPHHQYSKIVYDKNELSKSLQKEIAKASQECKFITDDDQYFLVEPLLLSTAAFLVSNVTDELMVRPNSHLIYYKLGSVTLILLLFTSVVTLVLAWHTFRPINKLAALVKGTTPSQLPKNFSDAYPNNEIGDLARALEEALNRVDLFIEREKEFTRDVSHELRTPIAIIHNAAELLLLKEKNKDVISEEELAHRIDNACSQISITINTILAMAREQKELISSQQTPILPILEQVIIQYSYKIDTKKIKIDVDVPSHASLKLNEGVLYILFSNLIGNAFQYTTQGNVSIAFYNNMLVIEDTGEGVDENLKATIYKPLAKGKNSTGFGIGLSLVKRLTESIGAKVLIQSKEQSGTKVKIIFPEYK